MPPNEIDFQPGAMLHEVIVGAFRARGLTFDTWCKANGITPGNERNATFGQGRGLFGQKNLQRIIDGAGRDFVRDAYFRRVAEHYAYLNKGAA